MLCAAVLVFGLIGLMQGDSGRMGLDWYSFDGHMAAAADASGVLRSFLVALAIVSLASTGLGVLGGGVVVPLSTAKPNAYTAFVQMAAIVASLIVVPITAWYLRLSVTGVVAIVFIEILLLVMLALRAEIRHGQLESTIYGGLFSFYELYTKRAFDEEKVRLAQTYTDFLSNAKSPTTLVLAFAVPICLAITGLLAAAVIVTFGTGLFITTSALLSARDLGAVGGIATNLVDIVGAIPSYAILIAAVVAAVAALHHYLHAKFGDSNRVILIRAGYFAYSFLYFLGMLAVAFYALVATRFSAVTLDATILFAIIAPLSIATYACTALHRIDSLVTFGIACRHDLRIRRFWIENQSILSKFDQPENPKGYLFLSTQTDTYSIACSLLVICRLRQLGWLTVIMDRWPIPLELTGQKQIDRFIRVKLGTQRALNFDWKIDWENKIVEAVGMNFYHPIWEGLSRHLGRYTIELEKGSEAAEVFRAILQTADATLLNCYRILNSIAGRGKPVRILGSSAHYVPNAVFNIFCREVGKRRDMHFVCLQQGYQTYYYDKGVLSKRISLENMTRKWPYSNPYLPQKDDFEAWVAKGQDLGAIVDEAREWTRTKRATEREDMSSLAEQAFDEIVAHRETGKPVVLILGKMVFDLSTPWDRGPAHSSMYDWLNHTVEVAAKAQDVLFVVKPHPYENRLEIAGIVEQYFTDLIETDVPGNVLLLGHDWFNLFTLFQLIDLGVLWNGTSGLELGLQSIPVVMCSDWGPIDYPIGFAAPKDRTDYERMLKNPNSVEAPEDLEHRCALLLKYTSSEEVMIPYDYCARPLTNEPFGPPYWYRDQVKHFLAHGDPYVDLACKKIL